MNTLQFLRHTYLFVVRFWLAEESEHRDVMLAPGVTWPTNASERSRSQCVLLDPGAPEQTGAPQPCKRQACTPFQHQRINQVRSGKERRWGAGLYKALTTQARGARGQRSEE